MKWISAKDRLPVPCLSCLLWTKNNMIYIGSVYGRKKEWHIEKITGIEHADIDWITHWMPLPDPPEQS
jgi:hypothetical protein